MRRFISKFVRLAAVVAAVGFAAAGAEDRVAASKAQAVLAEAAEQQMFTYVFFWKENNATAKEMLQSMKTCTAEHAERIKLVTANITNPAEKEVVARFDVSRSPMPLILAVAPNGAVTGVFADKVTPDLVRQSLATPRMTECMKAMQEGKLVLLCVQPSEQSPMPRGVRDFVADPEFKKRTTVITMQAGDPSETRFMKELQVAPASLRSTTVVFMAPPTVLVGKFAGNVSSEELAMKLHAAGKCCDDKNCKHNKKGN